jgi:outer membrane protein OmpA-like peptidoglycan-associated protein
MPKLFWLPLAFCAVTFAQETQFTVQLTAPLSTSSNHKGDPVYAQVLSPDTFRGDMLQGHITELKSGNKIHGESVLNFNFDALQHGNTSLPISSSITSMSNSKGQVNLDEEGRVIRKSSNVGKAAAGTGAGALIGGLTHGVKGAAIGAGIGAAASLILIEVAAEGPKLEFARGSQMGLAVKSRGGAHLASLRPNNPMPTPTSAPPPAYEPPPTSTPVSTPPPASQPAAAQAGPPSASDQPQLSSVKIDFIPGERTVFFDDFSDMASDEPPPHWKVRGNPVELRSGGGVRELYAKDGVEMTSPTFAVPDDFTFELEWTGGGQMTWHFRDKENADILTAMVRGEDSGQDAGTHVSASGSGGDLGDGKIQVDTTSPVHYALWVQRGRVRAYLNGQRLLDVNQVAVTGIDHIFVEAGGYRPNGIRQVRIAESAPDFSYVMSSTGKYITHGILFDTDSDRLRPESAPVMKMVSQGLEKNPNLKLEIDGYTDSTGNDQHNLDLSQRRAAAVRSVLIGQYGVDAARLTASGFGPAKPVASNDTPDGRAQNRRVEFLKQ